MATKGTKVPSIYKVPSKADPELKQFANSVKEALEVRLGRRGDPRDRAITLRELINSGMAQELLDNPFDPNAGTGITDFGGTTPYTDFTIPPTPTGFSVTASYTSFILAWDNPQMSNFGNTEIWRSTTSSLGDAVKVDTTSAFVWSEEVGYNKTYYYWVRHVSNAEVFGAYSPSGNGTTSIDIAAVMANLSETLADLPGYSTLTSLIDSSAGTAATVIKSASAPTQRANGDALTGNDIWYDTDDGQVYTRNADNDDWVAARDATLVNLFGTTSFTGSSLSAAMASAQSDVVTLTNANSSRVSEITSLTATVDTKAKTFVQTSAPTATAVGDLWIDSDDDNKLYRASAVGASNWVAVRDTANDNYPRVFTQASQPTAVNTGDLWFDSDDSNKQYRWDGSNWVEVRDITTQAAVNTEATARAAGDTANATSITNLTATVNVKNQTFVSSSAPTAVATGDLWVDTNSNNALKRWDGSNWVAVRDTANDGKATIFTQDDVPTSGVKKGDIWFDTNDSNKQYRADSDGSNQVTSGEWEEVRDVTTQAALTSEASTRASADTANSTAITNLSATVDTKIKTFVQNGIPTAVAAGDLWIDSNDNNKLYRAAAAGSNEIKAGEWVAVRDTANDGKTTVFTQTGQPTANNTGDLWFDTDDSNKQYRWDGSNWQVVRDVVTQASVTTVQNAVANGTSAQAGYGVAVNANGAVAGMYLMADSSGTLSNNTSTSNIIFEAGQVTIRNPHGSNIVPFTVLTSTDGAGNPAGVYIDTAFIKDAAITSAKIGSLSADLVNAVQINAGSIGAGTLNADRVAANSIDIAGKSIADSLGRATGTAGNDVSMTSYSEISQSTFVRNAPHHIAEFASTAGPGVSVGDVMGGSPLFSHTFTTYSFSGNKDFIITVTLDPLGSYDSYSETGFAFAMRATSSSSAYTATTSGSYVTTRGTSRGGTGSSSVYTLSDIVSLAPSTQYYIWVFGNMDDVDISSAGARGIRDGQITVVGLNK